MTLRVILGFVGCAQLLLWVWLLAEYGRLPPRLATRFDVAGAPIEWANTSALAWFGPPLIGVWVVSVLIGGGFLSRWMARRHPTLVNMPYKERWLALPEAARAWCIDPLVVALAASALPITGIFAYIAWSAAAVGAGRHAAAPTWPVMIAIGLVLAMTLGSIVVLARRVLRAAALA